MLAKLAGDAQLASVGIADPFAVHRSRSLLDHLEDFRRYQSSKGATEKHVQGDYLACLRIINGCAFTRSDDLQAQAVAEFLAALRRDRKPAALDSKRSGTN